MIGMTLCSGIGAPEMAAPWVDWRVASEIEKFPRAVLQERLGYKTPSAHNQGDPLLWGDMTEITPALLREHGIPLPDLIVARTPCQAFSIAGLRGGTSDARGNLTLKFVETCHATVDARPDGNLAVLWENVPGVLSDRGNAFGCFLAGLVGADDAFLPAEREWGWSHASEYVDDADGRPIEKATVGGTWCWQRISWPSAGMVAGPRARAAWRVLDAQYFGVAQRRRRVFLIVDFGGCIDPAAVLFERQGLRGNTPPSRETGQSVAASLTASTGGCSGKDKPEGRLIASEHPYAGTVSSKWAKGSGGPAGDECQNLVAHALRGEGFDASEDGTGRGTPLVPVAGAICRDSFSGGPSGRPDGAAAGHFVPVAFSSKDHGADALDDLCPTIRAGGHDGSHANAGVPPAVAFQDRFRGDDGRGYDRPPAATCEVTGALETVKPWHVAQPWAVRRLTPTECARLQGFPNDHTAITYRGKPAADGPQYKALGNSMAVPCVKWIMDRMQASMSENSRTAA